MDPNYLKYLGTIGVNPSQFIEMQANYLRLLANCYSTEQQVPNPQVSEPRPGKKITRPVENPQNTDFPESELTKPLSEEPVIIKRPVNLHDELPVRSLSVPFEKLLEEEIKKTGKKDLENDSSGSKHSFLKRKSQNVVPKKETTPNIASPKSQFSAFARNERSEESEEKSIRSEAKVFREDKVGIRKSVIAKQVAEPENSLSDSPKPKQEFLKRGAGKLCVQQRSSSLARLDSNSKKKFKHSASRVSENSREQYSEAEEEEEEEKKPEIPQITNKNYLKYKKLQKELESKKQKLEKDAMDFYKMRESEVKSLEMWKNEEMKKISEERKKIEKIHPNESFESENLRKEIKQLKLTLSKNEEKYSKTIDSLKEIIETLTLRNQELARILQDKTFESLETEEKPSKSSSEVSVKLKPSRIAKPGREETPKFKKFEKNPPTFTFKLPDKNSIEDKASLKKPKFDSAPVVEIKLEEPKSNTAQEIVDETKTQKIFDDGKREICFSNGVKKEIYPDGYMIVHFNNKDKKETFPDGKIVYHFFENKTIQTTFSDGLQLFQFSNGQTEKHFADGTKEIKFPDGTIKCIFTDGEEESIFPDGTVQKIDKNGVRVIEFVNGMKDTVMPDGSKIRVYPDGKVKKTSADGKPLN